MLEGKRKLIYFTLALLGVVVLGVNGSLTGEALSSAIWALCLTFAGGNGAEHFSKRPKL